MAKSKAQTQQTNWWQLSYSWLATGFIASLNSHLYDCYIQFDYFDNDVWTKQTDIIGKMTKIGVQQSTLWYHLDHYKNKKKTCKQTFTMAQ